MPFKVKEIEKIPYSDGTVTSEAVKIFGATNFGGIKVKVEFDKKEYLYTIAAHLNFGYLSYLNQCGTTTIPTIEGTLLHIKQGAEDVTNAMKGKLSEDTKAFRKLQEGLFAVIAEGLITRAKYGSYNHATGFMFGGKQNWSKEQFLGKVGVFSGSFAKYLKKKKIGTITMSHVYQNPYHKTATDCSMQQFFVWTPPKGIVVPGISGVYNQMTEESEAKLKKLIPTANFKLPTYIPRYLVPDTQADDVEFQPKKKVANG